MSARQRLAAVTFALVALGAWPRGAGAAEKPAAGMFLVAGSDLRDPNFARTVVLLVDYGPHGAAGVIVNRPTEMPLEDLLPEIEGLERRRDVVYQGGPVATEGAVVLLRSVTALEDARAVFGDVYVGSSRELLERLAAGGVEFRVFAGYAGWAPGQLDWELAQGGWSLLPADAEAVFDDAPDELWRRLEPRGRRSRAARRRGRGGGGVIGLLNRLADASIFFSFDRSGFLRHRREFRRGDLDVDLAAKRCLVTGANSGLGKAAAHALAELGAEVWLLCRSEERGRAAESEIRRRTDNERLRLEIVDMADRRSILDLARRVGDTPVDVLIHNAGVLPERREETADGLELTWATNVVGQFLLTHELMENLRMATQARVITVSSGGMYTQRLDLRDVHWRRRKFDGVVAYAQTKRAEVILAELWAEQAAGDEGRVTFNSMHPGWADTPGVKSSLPRFWRFTRNRLRTPEQGADTIVWLAACERLAGETGKFWFDRRAVDTHYLPGTRERPEDRRRLWEMCREQAGIAEVLER